MRCERDSKVLTWYQSWPNSSSLEGIEKEKKKLSVRERSVGG